jgi:F420-dependent oxidoreductase-like protein
VSGPQVSEGWHGVRFDHPLERTREYVDIVRMALRRETVAYRGRHFQLPLPDGPGKALKLIVHPVRAQIPVYLAAVGPRNLALAGEIADGWLAIFFSPEHAALSLDPLRMARSASGRGPADDPLAGFDVVASVPVSVADDVPAAAEPLRGYAALYIGGMGSRERNFYNALARRMGFDEAAQRVQDLYLDHRPREAAAAVPVEFVDATSLLGPMDRIRDRLAAFAEAGVTTLSIMPTARLLQGRLALLRGVAEALEAAGLAS